MALFAITLAGGSLWFLAVVVAFVVAVVFGLYTRRGSAINQHPYGNPYSAATGSRQPSSYGNDRVWAQRLTRGTR